MLGERTATKQEEEAMNQPGDWLGILCCSCYNFWITQETAKFVIFKWWKLRTESEFRHHS